MVFRRPLFWGGGSTGYVAPVAFEIADEDLVVQIVRLNLAPCHVGREAEHFGGGLGVQITRGNVEFLWDGELFIEACQHKSPFSEGGDVNVIRRSGKAGGFEGGDDRPVGVGGEVGRGGLDDDFALRLKMAGDEAVHGDGIEFAQ